MIEERFLSIIKNDETCDRLFNNRIFPLFNNSIKIIMPYCIYIIFDESKSYTFDERSDHSVEMQVSIYADNYDACKSIKNAIIHAIERYAWTHTQFTLKKPTNRYFYEQENKRYHCALDLSIWSAEEEE